MNNYFHSQWYLKQTTHNPWVTLNPAFTPMECQTIQQLAEQYPRIPARVGRTDSIDNNIRRSTIRWFDSGNIDTQWIYKRLTDQIMTVNEQAFKYDLDYIECLQYTEYLHPNDANESHVDMWYYKGMHNRKLSFSLQLTDPTLYTGCDLEMMLGHEETHLAGREQGALHVFPSFQMHRVTPLLTGQRASLVGWVAGPPWR